MGIFNFFNSKDDKRKYDGDWELVDENEVSTGDWLVIGSNKMPEPKGKSSLPKDFWHDPSKYKKG